MMTVTSVGVEYKMVFIPGQVFTTVVSVHCVRRVDYWLNMMAKHEGVDIGNL